jgi:hypothetical protein
MLHTMALAHHANGALHLGARRPYPPLATSLYVPLPVSPSHGMFHTRTANCSDPKTAQDRPYGVFYGQRYWRVWHDPKPDITRKADSDADRRDGPCAISGHTHGQQRLAVSLSHPRMYTPRHSYTHECTTKKPAQDYSWRASNSGRNSPSLNFSIFNSGVRSSGIYVFRLRGLSEGD